jgi:hypothetical protein
MQVVAGQVTPRSPTGLNARALQNWFMQATGGEMMRAAVVYMVRAGLTLCATAHDAIMIMAPVDSMDRDVALAREIMERVSLSFTRGLMVRTEVKTLMPGERYLEKRGRKMWDLIMGMLEASGQPNGSDGLDGSDGFDGSDGSDAMGPLYASPL